MIPTFARRSLLRQIPLAVSCLLALGAVQAQERITFAATGGFMQTASVDTMLKPATDKLGMTFRQETLDNIASIRVQVQSGKPAWDIVKVPAEDCAAGAKEGLFEKLDYSQIPTDGIPASGRDPVWVAANMVSTMMVWRTDKFKPGAEPKTWADFWDVQKFPGRRSLPAFPQETLEIALMADGVAPDKLYPLDIERAFKSLEKIKPHIAAWWKTGNQGAQLLTAGEVDVGVVWGSRLATLLKDKEPVNFTYNQGLLGYSCLAIPKGAARCSRAEGHRADAQSRNAGQCAGRHGDLRSGQCQCLQGQDLLARTHEDAELFAGEL
ncbi:ABC transporter substrate-binding protein (plasmid) [Polaromonas sp. P1-6]|nr:ABC transporter substrate-binding protein [Polaromonas sp. P1-6]